MNEQKARGQWDCERCDLPYTSEEERLEHIRGSPNHIPCLHCPGLPESTTMHELYLHQSLCHYLCLVCGIYCSSKGELRWHEDTHPRCPVCKNRCEDFDGLVKVINKVQ